MTHDIVGLQTPEETEDYLQKETDTKRSAILLFADSSKGKQKNAFLELGLGIVYIWLSNSFYKSSFNIPYPCTCMC